MRSCSKRQCGGKRATCKTTRSRFGWTVNRRNRHQRYYTRCARPPHFSHHLSGQIPLRRILLQLQVLRQCFGDMPTWSKITQRLLLFQVLHLRRYAYRTSFYKYRTCVGMFGTCSGVKLGYYCYYATCKYSYRSSCYEFKTYVGRSGMTYVGPSGSCSGGVRSATDHCYSNSCHDYPYASSCYKNRKIIRHSGTCTGVRLGS